MRNVFNFKSVFLIVLISIFAAFFSGGLIMAFGLSKSNTPEKIYTFISFIVGQGFMIIPLIWYIIWKKAPLLKTIRLNPVSLPILTYTVLFSLGLIILSDELDRVMQIFIPAPEYIMDLNKLLKPDTILGFVLLFIAVGVLAPIGEELLFRGFLQQYLEKYWADTTRAILVTALVFSAIHMNPYWFIQIYFLGIMLGFLAWKTNSIIPPLILHSLNNTMAMLLSFSESSENSFYIFHGHVSPWIFIFAIGITIYGFKNINKIKIKKT